MNNPNILLKLVSSLPYDAVNVLRKSTSTLNNQIKVFETSNYYWVLKVENDFNLTIPIDQLEDWYSVYREISMRGIYYLLYSWNINLFNIGLMNGLDPSAFNNDLIVYYASSNGIEFVKLLLNDDRVDPSARNNDALIQACISGNEEIVLLLINDKRIDLTICGSKGLIQASKHNHPNIVRILLQDGRPDPSDVNNLALKIAARNGYMKVVDLLLRDGRIDPSLDNNSTLTLAFKHCRWDIVELLLRDDRVRALYA